MYLLPYLDSFTVALFLGLLVYAAIKDVSEYKIPNSLTLSVVFLYPAHVLASPVAVDWLGGIIVATVVLMITTGMFAARILGGGDVKLIVAVSLWAGPAAIVDFIIVTALCGAMLAIVMFSPLRYAIAQFYESLGYIRARDAVLGNLLPYGVAISAGGVAIAPDSIATALRLMEVRL